MITEELKNRYKSMTLPELDSSLFMCCSNGYINSVKYLLTSPELKIHPDIHTGSDDILIHACINGQLEIVQYLLTSPDLEEYCDIHNQNDRALIGACRFGKLDVVRYLVFDYKMKSTKHIEKYLNDDDEHNVIDMFKKQKFENKLQSNLKNNDNVNYKIKI